MPSAVAAARRMAAKQCVAAIDPAAAAAIAGGDAIAGSPGRHCHSTLPLTVILHCH
jgi:hypothetical protein